MTQWDPQLYLTYADHRARPFYELTARIDATSPRRVVDLGCGAGNLTEVLRQRWSSAAIEALDSSPDMVADARSRGIDARVGDVRTWTPPADADVVVSNAVLHWLPDHRELLQKWLCALAPGAWLAIQVPANFDAPSHRLPRELAASPAWSSLLGDVGLLGPDAVSTAQAYGELMAAAGAEPDVWETTYVQRLTGDDAVLEWISGTALRPVRSALDDAQWERFRAELAPMLREAYPPRPDGTTWLPFRRVFAVARVSGEGRR